jgi:hypothetical protein
VIWRSPLVWYPLDLPKDYHTAPSVQICGRQAAEGITISGTPAHVPRIRVPSLQLGRTKREANTKWARSRSPTNQAKRHVIPVGGHCCIKAKGVLAVPQSGDAGPSDTLENRNKPGI